jgi:hypothetical protein
MSSVDEFGCGLAAKLAFSYRTGQTVNLLALRLQWFESTPAQASLRAILQVLKPLGWQWSESDINPFCPTPARSERG